MLNLSKKWNACLAAGDIVYHKTNVKKVKKLKTIDKIYATGKCVDRYTVRHAQVTHVCKNDTLQIQYLEKMEKIWRHTCPEIYCTTNKQTTGVLAICSYYCIFILLCLSMLNLL